MKLVVEGVMGGTLPWGLVLAGVGIAVMVEVLHLPILPVAIGLYLPIHLSAPIFAGGLVRWAIERKKDSKDAVENGVLYSSGLIAGEGLIGILLAVFAIIPVNGGSLGDAINMGGILGNIGGVIFFAFILFTLVHFSIRKKKKQ
jgi:uncharacterized oligopeptide transporter (OPT) family protein